MTDTMGADNTGRGLEIVAGIGAAFGDLTAELRRNRQWQLDRIPIAYRKTGNATVPAGGGNIGFDLGGPALGRTQHIRRVVIGGATFGSSVAGTAELYAAAMQPAVAATIRDLQYLVDEASGSTPPLPSIAFYAPGQIVLQHPEKLIVVIVGGTANTQYIGTVQSDDFRADAVPGAVPV